MLIVTCQLISCFTEIDKSCDCTGKGGVNRRGVTYREAENGKERAGELGDSANEKLSRSRTELNGSVSGCEWVEFFVEVLNFTNILR